MREYSSLRPAPRSVRPPRVRTNTIPARPCLGAVQESNRLLQAMSRRGMARAASACAGDTLPSTTRHDGAGRPAQRAAAPFVFGMVKIRHALAYARPARLPDPLTDCAGCVRAARAQEVCCGQSSSSCRAAACRRAAHHRLLPRGAAASASGSGRATRCLVQRRPLRAPRRRPAAHGALWALWVGVVGVCQRLGARPRRAQCRGRPRHAGHASGTSRERFIGLYASQRQVLQHAHICNLSASA